MSRVGAGGVKVASGREGSSGAPWNSVRSIRAALYDGVVAPYAPYGTYTLHASVAVIPPATPPSAINTCT